jgi:hypothetical protein
METRRRSPGITVMGDEESGSMAAAQTTRATPTACNALFQPRSLGSNGSECSLMTKLTSQFGF